ncbi:hypothetical protein EMIT0210MI2_250138 [Priestia megaterium]
MIFDMLHNITFCDYLLCEKAKENKGLNSLINVVNKRRKANYQLSDFHIRF